MIVVSFKAIASRTFSSMAMRGFSPSLENALALDSAARPDRCEAGCCGFGADITTSWGL